MLQQYCLARCSAGNGCPGRAAATDLLLQVLHELLAVDGGALGAGALRLHHKPPLGADRLRGGRAGRRPARSPARLHQHLGNVWAALAASSRLDLPLTGCCCSRAAPFRLLRCWTRAAVGARRALQAMAVCILPVTVRVVGRLERTGGSAQEAPFVHARGCQLRRLRGNLRTAERCPCPKRVHKSPDSRSRASRHKEHPRPPPPRPRRNLPSPAQRGPLLPLHHMLLLVELVGSSRCIWSFLSLRCALPDVARQSGVEP